jgi:excinuclease ABC subunit C
MLSQLFFREGKLIGSEHYSFTDVVETSEELLSSFMIQYYKDRKTLPTHIIVPLEVPHELEDILHLKIILPERGEKKEIAQMATKNAQVLFKQEKDDQELAEKMLLDLQESLHLSRYPSRIECFDTSNISGTDIVASMVAFTQGKYDKSRGRLYKIKNVQKGDDYAALKEALSRRLNRAKQENDLPDLVIVDGGKGQLSTALDVFKTLDIATVDLISLAKQAGKHDKTLTQERVFLPNHSSPILLPLHSPLLFLLQRIRDETHRRAIGFHRKRRDKRVISSLIDEIPGIGDIKRKKLLRHFGSLQRILAASPADLLAVKGITSKDVEQIQKFAKKL